MLYFNEIMIDEAIMNNVIIVTDSSAYLPKAYVDQYKIPVVPLTEIGRASCRERV